MFSNQSHMQKPDDHQAGQHTPHTVFFKKFCTTTTATIE